jgi:hypothetical protein
MQEFAAQHPEASIATQIAGGLAGGAAAGMAAPAPFGASSLPAWANIGIGGATNAGLSAADTAVRGGSQGDIERSALLGGGLGALGAGIGSIGRGIAGPILPEERANLAATAVGKYDIPLTGPQVSTSPGMKIAESTVNRLPFSGAEGSIEAQRTAWNRAVIAEMGEDADRATPDVMNAARRRIGAMYDQVAQNTVIHVDNQFLQNLHDTLNQASQVLPKSEAEPLVKQAQNIIEKIDRTSKTIPGDVYQALTNTGAPLDRLLESENPNISYYANGLKKVLDGALERSASPADQAMLQAADKQWATMRTIQPIVAKSPTGDISPALLAGQVNKSTGNGMAFGHGGNLGELARIGQAFLKEPGSSNTAERALTMAGFSSAATGLGALAHGALGVAAGNLGAIPLVLAAGRAGGAALRSQWLGNALIKMIAARLRPVGRFPAVAHAGRRIFGQRPPPGGAVIANRQLITSVHGMKAWATSGPVSAQAICPNTRASRSRSRS